MNNNEKSPQTDELLEQTKQMSDANLDRKREEVAAAEASLTPDREPFNLDELRKLYSMSDSQGVPVESQSWVEDLKYQYYIENPELKTMADFAAHRDFLDAHNVN